MGNRAEQVLKRFRAKEALIDERLDGAVRHARTGVGTVQLVGRDGAPVRGAALSIRQKSHKFKYGANLFMLDEFESAEKNALYRDAFAKSFNLATLPFYWSDLEPQRGKPRFAADSPRVYRRPAPDLCLAFCEEKGITPKAHCLNYDAWTPLWVPDDVDGVKRCLDRHMAGCAARYAERIPGWEVTNETFCAKYDAFEQGRKSTEFFASRDLIEWSFATARRHFPLNELIINEASHAWTSLFWYRRGAYYQQIEQALAAGAPIDAVGLQFHMFFRAEDEARETRPYYDPEHLYRVMDAYASLGLNLQITEITVPCYTDSASDEEVQAQLLEYLCKIWFSHPAMEAAVYWNLVDGYAAFAPQGEMSSGENVYRGGLMRFDTTPKPALAVLRRLFQTVWHTECETGTDDGGRAEFRGFYGDYEIEARHDGRIERHPARLTKKSRNLFRLETDF